MLTWALSVYLVLSVDTMHFEWVADRPVSYDPPSNSGRDETIIIMGYPFFFSFKRSPLCYFWKQTKKEKLKVRPTRTTQTLMVVNG